MIFFALLFTAFLTPCLWSQNAPSFKRASPEPNFSITTTNIAGQSITRSIPIIDGIVVEGADEVLNDLEQGQPFAQTYVPSPSGPFKLSPAEALEKALQISPNSTLQDPYVEKIGGIHEKVWLNYFAELRPAYKTRLPQLSIYDLKDIYIDGENGEVLKIEDSAMFKDVKANLYVYSPNPSKLQTMDLREVELSDLNDVKENGHLLGDYVSVRSCCQYFVCPEKDECNELTKRCVIPSHPDARQNREVIHLPSDSLGLDPMMSLPKDITVNTVRCTYVPQARMRRKGSDDKSLGFFEKPLDEPGFASEMDQFSEVQAYFSVSNFFKHIRTLLQDKSWCLRSNAMSCNSDGTPVKDAHGKVTNPYKVFVNQVIPDMRSDKKQSSDPENFVMQLMAGKGTPENPVVLNRFSRIGNAAFIPALSTLKKSTPKADEILSDLIKPYDHNVFFQGDRDFAYDGDVVFHEFMHAVTTSLVGKLNAMGINQWGIHSEPGSLNEAWSDYFAAAFTNRSTIGGYAAIKDGFGEASLRNIKNNNSCPQNVIGEIHNDSQVWSGALWEIRDAIIARSGQDQALDFDRAVLASLAQAKDNEDFKTQSNKLLENIKKRPSLGPAVASLAHDILIKRGVKDCFRAFRLSMVDPASNEVKTQVKNMLFVPSKLQIGLKNYAPASSQLEVAIPQGTQRVTLSWRQYMGSNGALMGEEARPDRMHNMLPLGAITSFDQPIKWKFPKATSIPTKDGEPITDEPAKAVYDNGSWHLRTDLSLNPCQQHSMFISLLSNDFKYVLKDIKVHFDIDESLRNTDCQLPNAAALAQPMVKPRGCSSTTAPLLSIWLFALLLWLRRRKEAC